MKLPAFLLSLFIGLFLIAGVSAAGATSSRVADKEEEAQNDLLLGMAGLKRAASDPKMIAQLMADLQVRTHVCSV